MRYFYGNTRLDGTTFEYLADPVKILKGRLIAAAAFVLIVFAQGVSPFLYFVGVILLLILTPWVISRSCHFRCRYSSWRGINFRFKGTMGGAAISFVGWYFLASMFLGVLIPIWLRSQMQYVVNNAQFGGASFHNTATNKDFYAFCIKLVVGMIFAGAIVGGFAAMSWWLAILVGYFFYLLAFAYFKVNMANLRMDGTTLGRHTFQSSYEWSGYTKLLFGNTLGMALTLGLFYPFARVRTARYAAEHVDILASGNLDEFIATQEQAIAATGAEVGDFFEIDVGF
jgi:uncharacterized membrane protein YjgN (DUF898 family)